MSRSSQLDRSHSDSAARCRYVWQLAYVSKLVRVSQRLVDMFGLSFLGRLQWLVNSNPLQMFDVQGAEAGVEQRAKTPVYMSYWPLDLMGTSLGKGILN